MIVTGIGSRETPQDILALMEMVGEKLMNQGDVLRSGGAPGADQAFERGAAGARAKMSRIQEQTEIYLPWKTFEQQNRTWIEPRLTEPADWAYAVAEEYHPSFRWLKQGAKKLHARNVHQVLGPFGEQLEVSDVVICWTKGAKGGGGTGQAIRIAKGFGVEVLDLADPNDLYEIKMAFGFDN